MLDFKTHIPSVFGPGLWLITTAAVPFLRAFLPQLSIYRNQLSIFPTATLPFVILSLEKKACSYPF
jgi:hypothetical protein